MSRADRRLLAEAGALLGLVRVSLLVLPYTALRRLLRRYVGGVEARVHRTSTDLTADTPARVSWAMGVLSRRSPGPTTCLAQALTADALLRRRGYASELRIGVRERGRYVGVLRAHAWVECGGVVVVGRLDDLAEYSVLAGRDRS